MSNILSEIFAKKDIDIIIKKTYEKMYIDGPINRSDLETLAYIKYMYPDLFSKYEDDVLNIMGLFFKSTNTNNIKSLIMKNYGESIKEKYGQSLTPMQMDIKNNILENKFFSFSAATSTGKSFVFRDILIESKFNIVIIVPSRALINEYYIKVTDIFKDKSVNVLTYIDFINKKKKRKNIFIVTPERAKEIFKFRDKMEIELVLFDEAQLSDDPGSRGIIFDTLVRRIKKFFPETKMLFAFPYIDNPDAELVKNGLNNDIANYKSYQEKNVGQIFFSYNEGDFYAFGIEKDVMGNNKIKVNFDPIARILEQDGSLLIYTSKSKIISEKIIDDYQKYCEMCSEITDVRALKLIEKFDNFMGTTGEKNKYGYSQMSKLLRRGIILHHGSLPLKARLIIEELTRNGYCNICFSTSTLVQGINMPFDLVFLDKFDNKPLEIKNLIGRAGRSTTNEKFDYGIVVIKDNNKSLLRAILNSPSTISAESLLDTDRDLPEDVINYRDAIINDKFNDDYNLPEVDLAKITRNEVIILAKELLDLLFIDNDIIKGSDFSKLEKEDREIIYDKFQKIYNYYIGTRDLSKGEKSILSTSIRILLWQIQGKTFKQIVGYRYSQIRKNSIVRKLVNKYKENKENYEDFEDELEKIKVQPTMEYKEIPNKNLNFIPLFDFDLPAYKVSYDVVAFDTYDYIDRIIGFKLKDIYYALFNELYIKTNDDRAYNMALYIKYGTNNKKEIMLLRYGFDFETIEWLRDRIEKIDEDEILFKNLDIFTEEEKKEIENYI